MIDIPDVSLVRAIVIETVRESGIAQAASSDSSIKEDGSVVTEADHFLQKNISERLLERWPNIPFMGEEMEHARQARVVNSKEGIFWTLDPLDGTTNFSMGFPFYGVSLALIGGGEPKLGVVYDPVRDECFHAVSGEGAYLNDQRIETAITGVELHSCVANVDLKRLVRKLADRLVQFPPYRSQRNLGSCVLEWCWVAAGRIQLYLHGGQRMWDYAAGSLILREAGGMFSTLRGAPLDCQVFTKRSVVAAINEDLYREWFLWLRENDNRNLSITALMHYDRTTK